MNFVESIDRMDDDLDGELLAAVGLSADNDARDALASIGSMPVPVDLFRRLYGRLEILLPKSADPAFTLRSLERFISASRSPTALLALFERDDRALSTLLHLLGAGQRLSEWLVAAPESLDLVRASDGADASRETLVDEISAELETLAAHGSQDEAISDVLSGVFRRERLRIAYGDFVGQSGPSVVASQLSVLADAIIESAVQAVSRRLAVRYGEPLRPNGERGRFAVIALGPLGGSELGYDSPLDLIFLRDLCGPTDGDVNLPADEYFDKLAYGVQSLLSGSAHPQYQSSRIYDIASLHHPLTESGSLATTVIEAYRHYQLMGRTWERLLYVKSRCVAGSMSLGNEYLALMEPWVYRRYLEPADVGGLHTLARKFGRRVEEPVTNGEAHTSDTENILPIGGADSKSRPGGLNDIESIVALLQLINGGDLPQLRVRGTLEAIELLRQANCISLQEATLLSDHYTFLKRHQHCCVLESTDTEETPSSSAQLSQERRQRRIAWHLGHRDSQGRGDLAGLRESLENAVSLNRITIRRLLLDAIGDSSPVPAEEELLLDPEPDESIIRRTLSKYRMSDPVLAMNDFQRLATEPVPFLSSRKCRHHLAAIAPQLLSEIGRTPNPHATLGTLVEVSDSVGAKSVLWELFRVAPPTMHLVVRICACSPYLARILIRNPGMIDELIDSLLLDRLPSDRWLEASSAELCRSASDVDSIVASFKIGAHLQIGVRDVLGKDPVEATHAALASCAESVLRRVSESAMRGLTERYGDPMSNGEDESELVMLGLGKLGAREPNYFSDFDTLFLYTSDGMTRRRVGGHRTTTTNANFFTELAKDVHKRINHKAYADRLFELGSSINIHRNTCESPVSAASIDSFYNFYRRGEATLSQRLALCKARAITGSLAARERVNRMVVELLASTEWYPSMATQIRDLRFSMETTAADDNLKRAPGGTVDVELLTQTLQLKYAAKYPSLLVPGTLDALQRLSDGGFLDAVMATALMNNYRTLRDVESKLCLLASPRRHEIPDDPAFLELLACLMNEANGSEIMSQCREYRISNRRMFNQLMEELSR